MSVSRINTLVAALVLALPVATSGQDDSDAHEAITSITLPDTPQTAKPATPAPAQPIPLAAPGAAMPPDIQVHALGEAEGPAVGLIDGAGDIWNGSAKGDIEVLLSHALTTTDPPMRDIARRLILAKAEAPSGKALRAMLTIRIDKLLQAGLIDEAGALAAVARLPNDADFARVQADALLYAGRSAELCGDATAEYRQSSGETFWIEMRAYCAAIGGDSALAELTRAVLDARGGDPAFDTLLNGVLHGIDKPPTVKLAKPTALHVFMLRTLGLPITGAIAARGGTPENLFAARDTRNPPLVRLEAADRIVDSGAFGAAELRALLDAQILSGAILADGAGKLPFLAGQARLRRAVQTETQPERKAFLLATAMNIAEQQDQLKLAAAIDADLLAVLPPAKTPDAPLFARALLLAGNDDAAKRWPADGAPLQATRLLLSADTADAARLNKILAAFADGLSAPSDPAKPDTLRDAKASVLLMADALGRLPPDIAAKVKPLLSKPWGGKRPSELTMDRIRRDAFVPGKRGETLLRIADLIRTVGWRDMAPEISAECVRLIRTFGFADTAQAMARESVLLYVPPPPAPPAPAVTP